jgi:hypothetical protein
MMTSQESLHGADHPKKYRIPTASGNCPVKATLTEPKHMNRNDHPHPYGIMIGRSDLGTDTQSCLYCAADGNGNFIVQDFGPEAFQLNGRLGEANAAVHRAAGQDQPVTQEIAFSVNGDKIECAINSSATSSRDGNRSARSKPAWQRWCQSIRNLRRLVLPSTVQ